MPATPGSANMLYVVVPVGATPDTKGPVTADGNTTVTTTMPGPRTPSEGRPGRRTVVVTYAHLSNSALMGPTQVATVTPMFFGMFDGGVTPGAVRGARAIVAGP